MVRRRARRDATGGAAAVLDLTGRGRAAATGGDGHVLADTHTLLWLLSQPAKLDAAALDQLADPSTSIWVSAASAWEIAIKTRLGRLDGSTLLATWSTQLGAMRIDDLPLDSDDAILAGRLQWDHRDPFDRAIVAQALRRNLTIATRDEKILAAALTSTLEV